MIKLIKYLSIICCLIPIKGIGAEATINNGTNISAYKEVPITGGSIVSVGGNYSMNNFINNEEYKIEIVDDEPHLAQNIQISVGGSNTGSNVEFTWHTGEQFSFTSFIDQYTPVNQTQLIKFQIFRKGFLGIWTWESSFFYYLNTICKVNESLVQTPWPLTAKDYEVSGNLEVSSTTSINGGIAEFDGGSSVTFLPGFSSTLLNGGAILGINDGCGGAYRIHNSNIQATPQNTVLNNAKFLEPKIFPNPTQGHLHIQIPDVLNQTILILIRDISGKIIAEKKVANSSNIETLDLSIYKSGFYLCQVLSENQIIKTMKFSISK